MNDLMSAAEMLRDNKYPGRGIIVGKSADGESAFFAYFILGRSENSRNRLLEAEGDTLRTLPYDESLVSDPSLIIYTAMRRVGDHLILTNGDQTDTVADALSEGGDFFSALGTRVYEPDAPNYTPRISALIDLSGFRRYDMSIIRRGYDGGCDYGEYSFIPEAGVGHLLHTYEGDGDPLPSFRGSPRPIAIDEDLDAYVRALWDALDKDNKIALFARAVGIGRNSKRTWLFNQHVRRG